MGAGLVDGVVVTGAGQGTGKIIAQSFARDDARIVMLDRNVPAVPHQGMDFIRCEISSSGEVDAAIVEVLAVSGRIDILVNNAGINVEGGIG